MILVLGMAGWGVARASQKFFTPGIHITMKLADPAEGPSKTGFAPIVKTVLPDVVNISTSKMVKAAHRQRGNAGRNASVLPAILRTAIRAQRAIRSRFVNALAAAAATSAKTASARA